MDTGNYMANQMDNQIEAAILMKDAFDGWIYNACEIKAQRTRKDPQDIFSSVYLTDAKLSFLDGVSAEEYSKQI